MSACDHFIQNAWRPELCSTCQRAKSEHDGVSGSRTWRRKSEPNPNNVITGVRISALASKFQTRDVRSGSIPETESERARTLDRRTTKNKESKINTSRSTELLDSSVSSFSSLSSSSASTYSSAIFSSNNSAQVRLGSAQTKTQDLKSKNHMTMTGTVPQRSSEASTIASSSSNSQVSVIAATVYSNKSTPSYTVTSKTKATSSVVSSDQGGARTATVPSGGGKDSSLASRSSPAAIKLISTGQSGAETSKKNVAQSSLKSSSVSKNQPTVTLKEVLTSSSSIKSHQAVTSKEVSASLTSSSKKQPVVTIKEVSTSSSAIKNQPAVTVKEVSASSPLKSQPAVTIKEVSASSPLKSQPAVTIKEVSASSALKSQPAVTIKEVSASSALKSQPAAVTPKDVSVSLTPLSALKSQPAACLKDASSLKDKVPSLQKKRRVSIPDLEPEVIGHDGGLGNLYAEEETAVADSDELIYFSLTDEEKQFALLALGNTFWNSDTKNLQVEPEAASRGCREFEDLGVDQLWSSKRFKSLVNCDSIKKQRDFGTYPKISSTRQPKVSLRNLNLIPEGYKVYVGSKEGIDSLSDSSSRFEGQVSVNELKSTNSVVNSVNSDSERRVDYGSSCRSTDSGIEVGSSKASDPIESLTFTAADTTDSLHKSSNDFGLVDNGHPQGLSENNTIDVKGICSDPSKQDPSQTRSQSVDDEKSHSVIQSAQAVSTGMPSALGVSFSNDVHNKTKPDSTDQEGFQVVALLNDVLKDYGDLNESSTDDFGVKTATKETLKGKKSTDFEARMASVAATLDLTKQQQRGKRQAPRPPVSPPPEPNLSEGVSPKKVVNQPDPVFKMVTVGRSIVTLPPQQDMPPNNSVPTIVSYGLEDFGSFPETSDSMSSRPYGDGKSKKGITSFFRNILRRGKESTESFESIMNPDVQFHVKPEKKDVTCAFGSIDMPEEDPVSSSVDQKSGPKGSSQAKVLIIPSTSPPQKHNDKDGMSSSGVGNNGGNGLLKSEVDTATASTVAALFDSPIAASPPPQRRSSKGLASPQMMLKRATAKFSPPAAHQTMKTQEKEQDPSSSTKSYPATKQVVPPPEKLPVASVMGTPLPAVVQDVSSIPKDKDATPIPDVVHRRPKSPKRAAPPVPPARSSVNTGGKTGSSESSSIDLTKDLEWRLKKSTEQSGGGTLSRTELRESTRRSMPVPPFPPGERKEKSSTTTTGLGSPPVSPIRESRNSLPSSPSSPTGASFEFINTEWSGGSSSTIDDELPKFSEKIELPTVATQNRKGFLGKLGGNRKTKAPQPPSVKRAKSITQSSTLPRRDKKSKKINVADISGPVMVTDLTNTNVLENRRNTISLGDEPAFVALSASCILPGATNSTASVDKGGFDEFDMPFISPLGSLENLYEAILPKPEEKLFHYYDPPTGPKVLCPNIPTDGYLEPVPPLSSTANLTPSSSLSPSVTATIASNLSSSSSASSASSATTNASVVKSPLKTKPTSSRNDRTPHSFPANSKDSGSSSTSASSSETNSSENSGSSLTDSVQISSRSKCEPLATAKVGSSSISSSSVHSGLGPTFIEPEMTEQRRILLASQPIYEEIPNGGNEDIDDFEDYNFSAGKENGSSMQRGTCPPTGASEMSRSQMAHAWLQQSHAAVPPPRAPSSVASLTSSLLPSSSASAPSLGAVPSSPSHALSKQSATSMSSLSMSSSQMMTSSIMSTSLTSSMLPPPPPPPDHLPGLHFSKSHSASRETVSSESDTQSNCSNDAQSNCSTLSRPRPAPRRKPKRPDTVGSDQYVSMNKPNSQVSLSEDKLRDVFTKLTSITFHALQDIYAQCERILSVDRLDIPNSKMMKWADFDIYGQHLHASGRCVVYNAKMRANNCPCQLMILHSRPATEMCATSHPSLLRPSAVFADTIPFSFLTPDFIKTSQLLQNSVYDSSQARCFVAVGAFDIVESLDSHLALLRETMAQDLNVYLSVILTAAIQLLSAMSHCLDQGFSVTETDYNDVFLITRSDLRGKVVAFLPRQRSLDVPQGEAMCNFLDRLFTDNMPDHDDNNDESSDDEEEEDRDKIISSPRKVVTKLLSMLEPRRVECLGQVRAVVEYLLWGPSQSQLTLSPAEVGSTPADVTSVGTGSGASREQELYVWLEKERVSAVGRLARNLPGLGAGLTVEELYTLKFLLKSSAGCLAESLRRLSR